MRKRFAIIITLALTFLISGCYLQNNLVEFNVDFIVDGEVYDSVKTDKSTIKMPVDPKKDDYEFKGWFWDEDLWEQPFTLNSIMDAPLSETFRVYAKFMAVEENIPTPNPNTIGKFYQLQEAYDLGFITKADIQDIAFYFQGQTSSKYEPNTSKIPDVLETEIAVKIKQTFLDDFLMSRPSAHYTINDIKITKYCGNYNGSYAVYIDGLYSYTQALWSETVAGVLFHYLNGNYIRVWVEEENHKVPKAEGHFFMTGFGGGLMNFPYEAYTFDYQSNYQSTNSLVISSEEQLKIFSETYSQSWSEENNCWDRDDRFSDVIGSYDETYFQNRQLVTFFVTAAGGGYYFEFSSASYKDGVLTIEVNHMSQGGIGHCALVDWFAIVEVDKVPIDTLIVVKINNRNW